MRSCWMVYITKLCCTIDMKSEADRIDCSNAFKMFQLPKTVQRTRGPPSVSEMAILQHVYRFPPPLRTGLYTRRAVAWLVQKMVQQMLHRIIYSILYSLSSCLYVSSVERERGCFPGLLGQPVNNQSGRSLRPLQDMIAQHLTNKLIPIIDSTQ